TPTIVAVLTHRLRLNQLAGLLITATQIFGSDKPKLTGIDDPRVRVHTTRQIRSRSRDNLKTRQDLKPATLDRIRLVLTSHSRRHFPARRRLSPPSAVNAQHVSRIATIQRTNRRLRTQNVTQTLRRRSITSPPRGSGPRLRDRRPYQRHNR